MSCRWKRKACRIGRTHKCIVITASEPQVHWNNEEQLSPPGLACAKLDDLSFPRVQEVSS